MLGNCEKMVLISSTINEWPQNHQIDEKGLMASTGMVMQKQSQDQQQQEALKCPRCDSSNTKFCYYNNYSLSQPRHFCKACKRYWTRGGTLRNVPVGGGCRKNKRVKRPASSAIDTPSSSSMTPTATTTNHNVPSSQIDLSSTSNHINPLLYGLPTNPSEFHLSYPRFNSRVSNVDTVSGYDLQPPMNPLGLGFSSGLMASAVHDNGFNHTKQIQEAVTSDSLLSSYPIFGSSTTSTSASPTMASLIASIQQQRYISSTGLKDHHRGGANSFLGIVPYEDMQVQMNGQEGMAMKEVKMEESQNRLNWNLSTQNQIEQINSPDPSFVWNTTGVGAWLDPTANIGSSVPSLI